MAHTPLVTPVWSSPYRPPGVAVPATAKTAMTDNTNIASLLTTRTGALVDKRFTFSDVFVEAVGNVAITAGKLYLLETQDGATYRELAQKAHASQSPTTTTGSTRIQFDMFTADKPLMITEGTEIVIATAVAQTAGGLIAYLSAGRIFG